MKELKKEKQQQQQQQQNFWTLTLVKSVMIFSESETLTKYKNTNHYSEISITSTLFTRAFSFIKVLCLLIGFVLRNALPSTVIKEIQSTNNAIKTVILNGQ